MNYYEHKTRLFQAYRPLLVEKFYLQNGSIVALFKAILFLGVKGK